MRYEMKRLMRLTALLYATGYHVPEGLLAIMRNEFVSYAKLITSEKRYPSKNGWNDD